MKKYLILLSVLVLLASSCNDWLDVRGENIQKEKDQFDNYKGFRDALTGCYMNMGSTDIYGMRLTMTDVENLADLWYFDNNYETSANLKYSLSLHDYSTDAARAAIKSIYANLFTTVSSANVILKNINGNPGAINDAQARAVIEGEAHAIRAYCQLDLLRLFGQLPRGGSRKVSLPYSFTTSIAEMPAYYSFDDYVALLKADISKAESLLKEYDPIMTGTYTELNSPDKNVQDDFLYYRQARLNYWAVRALHARLALYLGEKTEAHDIAMDIINAKNKNGEDVIALSGASDLVKGYNGLPSECLFYLSKYNINEYANDVLIGGRSSGQAMANTYYISSKQLTQLYATIAGGTASHNRYNYEWNRNTKDALGAVAPTIKKYWYDESSAESSVLLTKYQIIPMLRLSEVYLIAMETSPTLEALQKLYDTYMISCSYTLYKPFETMEEAQTELLNEYRREFFAEGQMFYTYKRKAASTMLWNEKAISENDYILPLPSSEYDPNTIK